MDARAAADRFLASPALSANTRRAYGRDVGEFCDWLGGRGTKLDDVDVRVLADYVSWLGGADGQCPYCLRGMENLCDSPTFTGYTVDGGYADYALARSD